MSSNKKPQTLHSFDALATATGKQDTNATSGIQTPKKIITLKKPNEVIASNTASTVNRSNIGWMFYKDYFKNVKYGNIINDKAVEAKDAILIKGKNQKIIDSKWVALNDGLGTAEQVIELKVCYPGLITGVGIAHEAGVEGEFKLGVHFDYTFGQPIIHGSSVKGLLRSVFPKEGKNKQGEDKDKRTPAKLKFFHDTLPDKLKEMNETDAKKAIKAIEKEIFDGIRSDDSRIDIYHRDIFFDAILKEPLPGQRILESDSITPHGTNPLKNPIPLLFLKINPSCSIQFRFKLEDGVLTIEEKIKLFTEIIKTLGIGAKTNVGYGQFEQ